MIVIDDVVISDEIKDKHFVCHLEKCKGECCVQGIGGAPLTNAEAELLPNIYEKVKPYMSEEGKATIARDGHAVWDNKDNEWTTPLRDSDTACAYVNFDENGITYCGIEKAHTAGLIPFKKPISCHLYPIRINSKNGYDAVNYDKWELCNPACDFGKELGVPLYRFLKEPLIRKYGLDFYGALEATIAHLEQEENK